MTPLMKTWPLLSLWTQRAITVAVDIAMVLIAGVFAALSLGGDAPLKMVLGGIALVAVMTRHRWPRISFLLTLPGFAWGFAVFPMMICLFAVAHKEPRISRAVLAAALAFFATPSWVVLFSTPFGGPALVQSIYTSALFAGLYVTAPTALGVSLRIRQQLATSMEEAAALHVLEQARAAEQALERERAVLAREMHDVVSNQVSLIAVQAGALRMSSTEQLSKDIAETIRELSVATLDELRVMIEVLRASGGADRGPAPQPTLADLNDLIRTSHITVEHHLHVPADLPMAVQRAVFRMVQEGLTNARKHSPGGLVEVWAKCQNNDLTVRVIAHPGTEPALQLPSGHNGLVGLRERAELLGGELGRHFRPDGTHELFMRLPMVG